MAAPKRGERDSSISRWEIKISRSMASEMRRYQYSLSIRARTGAKSSNLNVVIMAWQPAVERCSPLVACEMPLMWHVTCVCYDGLIAVRGCVEEAVSSTLPHRNAFFVVLIVTHRGVLHEDNKRGDSRRIMQTWICSSTACMMAESGLVSAFGQRGTRRTCINDAHSLIWRE